MTHDEVEAFLRAQDLWRGPPRIRALKGGYLNQVLAVATGDREYVFKRFAAAVTGTLFPNLPEDEARALQVLDGLDVAPRLVGAWPDRSLMIYDHVPGGPWVSDTGAVARLLLCKEAVDPTGFRAVAIEPAGIMAEAAALFARCDSPPHTREPRLPDLPPPDRLSLIHTDLGPGNLIGEEGRFRIIDWQCPAAGDLCEDIYSFLSPAFQLLSEHEPLTGDEVAAFWAALQRDDLRDRYDNLWPCYAWRMAAYCLWRSNTRPEADVRARYAAAFAAELNRLERHRAGD